MNRVALFSTRGLLLLGLAGGGCATTTKGVKVVSSPAKITLTSIEVDPKQDTRKNYGPLTLLGSFQLRSNDSRFGGISGIAIERDGRTLWGISDRGHWFKARLQLNQRGVLTGLEDVVIGPLRDPDGHPVQGKLTDAESLILDNKGGHYVSFEQVHRVWRYSGGLSSIPTPLSLPKAVNGAPHNGGLEAIGLLPDGRLLLLCEEMAGPGATRRGWVIQGADQIPLLYPVSEGFVPTDIAVLKSGVVLVLERHFSLLSGLKIRLRSINVEDLKPGAILHPKELVKLTRPLEVDNFEGLTATENHAAGMVTLYLISDDNFSAFQRTLLYQFRVPASALE